MQDPEKRFSVKEALYHPFFSPSTPQSKTMSINTGTEVIMRNGLKVLGENNGATKKRQDYFGQNGGPTVEKRPVFGHNKCQSTVIHIHTKMIENVHPSLINVRPFEVTPPQNRENKARGQPDKLSQYLSTIEDINIRKTIDSQSILRKIGGPTRTMSICTNTPSFNRASKEVIIV